MRLGIKLAFTIALAFTPLCAEAAPANIIDDIAKEMTQQMVSGWEEAHNNLTQYARCREKEAAIEALNAESRRLKALPYIAALKIELAKRFTSEELTAILTDAIAETAARKAADNLGATMRTSTLTQDLAERWTATRLAASQAGSGDGAQQAQTEAAYLAARIRIEERFGPPLVQDTARRGTAQVVLDTALPSSLASPVARLRFNMNEVRQLPPMEIERLNQLFAADSRDIETAAYPYRIDAIACPLSADELKATTKWLRRKHAKPALFYATFGSGLPPPELVPRIEELYAMPVWERLRGALIDAAFIEPPDFRPYEEIKAADKARRASMRNRLLEAGFRENLLP